jgi:hypothetical protein
LGQGCHRVLLLLVSVPLPLVVLSKKSGAPTIIVI